MLTPFVKTYLISYIMLHDGIEITRHDRALIASGSGIAVITGTQAIMQE